MGLLKRIAAYLWPTIFGPQAAVTVPEVDRIFLPPEPMFRDPREGEWRPL